MKNIALTIEITLKVLIELVMGKLTTFKALKISTKFSDIIESVARPTFVGINSYLSSTSGELANHVILCNFSYKNAVLRDLSKLQNSTIADVEAIAKNCSMPIELVNEAIEKLKNSFINNMNKETASNQSLAQKDTFTVISEAVKVHNETKQIYIYGLAISKKVIEKGEYKTVNSRPLTVAQNEVKKYFNFSSDKYRQFIVNSENLSSVKINGQELELC
jgi:hypothetical protein